MRKIGLLLAIMVLLTGVSVQAQKKSGIVPPPVEPKIIAQDDQGTGMLEINPLTGEFTAKLCEYSYEFSGKGTVKVDGCTVNFSALEANYRVYASLDMCDHTAKVVCQAIDERKGGLVPTWLGESFADSDMLDNSGVCGK